MRHVLVTNDFPPKVGGIQTYLWELWRRLPPGEVTVLTTKYEGAARFDADQPFRVERLDQEALLPTPGLRRRIDALATEVGAKFVVLDPALPLGLLGPRLHHDYALVLHGSELAGRLPVGGHIMGRVVRGAVHVVAGGAYPASEVRRVGGRAGPPVTVIPPGVDARRFRPFDEDEREQARRTFDLPPEGALVLGVSRLVARKGFDVLIEAAALLAPNHPGLTVAIAGTGRDHERLCRRVARRGAPVRMLGRVEHDRLPDLYACADVFAMPCRTQWWGLEVEGFGIVFMEAASAGVPQVAGASGGAVDAVIHGDTGLVVGDPADPNSVASAIDRLLKDSALAASMAERGRARAQNELDYDVLAADLAAALVAAGEAATAP